MFLIYGRCLIIHNGSLVLAFRAECVCVCAFYFFFVLPLLNVKFFAFKKQSAFFFLKSQRFLQVAALLHPLAVVETKMSKQGLFT